MLRDLAQDLDVLGEYRYFLEEADVPFGEGGLFLQVGKPTRAQGWILHISLNYPDIGPILTGVVMLYKRFGNPFKVLKNKGLHIDCNNGEMGQTKIGKIISIYLEDESNLDSVVVELKQLTNGLNGPKVITDFRFGSCLYARYGSFTSHVIMDGYGALDRVVMDKRGKWVHDKYRDNFLLPDGVVNPFYRFMDNQLSYDWRKHLPHGFILGSLIGDEIWGALYKAVISTDGGMLDCTLIRGRKWMYCDEFGRDIQDRFRWLSDILEKLDGEPGLPTVVDRWQDNDNVFLVLSKFPEQNILSSVARILNKRRFADLPFDDKCILFTRLLDLFGKVKMLHSRGYIHRNINPRNIYLNEDGGIFLSGLELAFDFFNQQPKVPFSGGEKGFVPPSMAGDAHPGIEDDIYSLGAVMINLFTGLPPQLLVGGTDDAFLFDKLVLLLGDPILSDLIKRCLSSDPAMRPTLPDLKAYITQCIEGRVDANEANEGWGQFDTALILAVAREGIESLNSRRFLLDGLWFSYVNNKYDNEVYPHGDKHVFFGLQRGIGGVLYLLSKARSLGLDIGMLGDVSKGAFEFLEGHIFSDIPRFSSGLHFGVSGLAVAITQAFNSDIIPVNAEYLDLVYRCLEKRSVEYGVIYGSAGDGLAQLMCTKYMDQSNMNRLISPLVNHLVGSQEFNGSWVTRKDVGEVAYGFGYGMAGIIYFLLEYGCRYNRPDAIQAAERGLEHLDGVRVDGPSFFVWPNSNLDAKNGSGWCVGGPGIVLTYLKSFELTGNKRHLEIAEKGLRKHPERIVYRNLSQCHGLAGLGEIYLEAFRVTGSQEWWERASWIAKLICTLRFHGPEGETYWLVERSKFSTADFMLGNTGVIHFLLRYLYPDKVFFPLLPEPVL